MLSFEVMALKVTQEPNNEVCISQSNGPTEEDSHIFIKGDQIDQLIGWLEAVKQNLLAEEAEIKRLQDEEEERVLSKTR
jgi:hypothetical protein